MKIFEKIKKLIKEIYKDYKESGNIYRTGCGWGVNPYYNERALEEHEKSKIRK